MNMRRLVLILVGLNVAVLGVVVSRGVLAAESDAPGVVRATAFELVDAAGTVRAQINVEEQGDVVLRLRAEDGAVRVKLGASESGSGLLLLDDQTEPGVHMLAKPEGPTITVRTKDGATHPVAP